MPKLESHSCGRNEYACKPVLSIFGIQSVSEADDRKIDSGLFPERFGGAAGSKRDHIIDAAANVQQKTPLQLFEELYELQNNQPMGAEQRALAQDLIEQLREERT